MIEQLKDMEGRTGTIEEALNNIVRVGTVVNRDPANYRCRVEFKDNDGLVSYWCQVLALRSYKDKYFWIPEIDEMVLCIFLPFGHEQGFIVGSIYNQKDNPPAKNKELVMENRKDIEITSTEEGIYITAEKSIYITSKKGKVYISPCAKICGCCD